jgi:hypothetical protein
MPILTTADPPRKRHAPMWVLILAVVALPLVGVFAWSCVQPVVLDAGTKGLAFGRNPYFGAGGFRLPGYWFWGVKLPGGPTTGYYVVVCKWP